MKESNKLYPERPLIRKLGTISCNNIVETTPVVFNGELYRFEVVRRRGFTSENAREDWEEIDGLPCLRFVHVRTNTPTPVFAEGNTFGFPFVRDGVMYVVTCASVTWGGDRLVFFKSADLVSWEKYSEVFLPGFRIFNMNIAEKDGIFTLLIEIDSPKEECGVPFTFRFLQSSDMINWTLTPKECVFQKDRYAGSPALYAFPDDPYYYVCYLEEYPTEKYANCIARSKDLINWEYSPINPVLMYNEAEDKKIGNPFLTPLDRERIRNALDINNSDMELCEYLGRTIIYYSWGNQHGTEFLAEACYEGPVHELLKAYFE